MKVLKGNLASSTRASLEDECAFLVVNRPRSKAAKEALTQKQSTGDGCDAASYILQNFIANFQSADIRVSSASVRMPVFDARYSVRYPGTAAIIPLDGLRAMR